MRKLSELPLVKIAIGVVGIGVIVASVVKMVTSAMKHHVESCHVICAKFHATPLDDGAPMYCTCIRDGNLVYSDHPNVSGRQHD